MKENALKEKNMFLKTSSRKNVQIPTLVSFMVNVSIPREINDLTITGFEDFCAFRSSSFSTSSA